MIYIYSLNFHNKKFKKRINPKFASKSISLTMNYKQFIKRVQLKSNIIKFLYKSLEKTQFFIFYIFIFYNTHTYTQKKINNIVLLTQKLTKEYIIYFIQTIEVLISYFNWRNTSFLYSINNFFCKMYGILTYSKWSRDYN